MCEFRSWDRPESRDPSYNTSMATDTPAPNRTIRGVRSWVRALRRRLSRGDVASPGRSLEALSSVFGPLELRLIEALWREGGPATVRDLQRVFPNVAYTTLMTTLDRLFKKGVLDRSRRGRAFRYAPRFDPDGLRTRIAADVFESLLGKGTDDEAVRPLLSCFIETVSRRDRALLDELEALVRERRRGRIGGKGRGTDPEEQPG